MLLAEGAIDIAAEFDVKPWDIAALIPIVREAGGTVTDVDGRRPARHAEHRRDQRRAAPGGSGFAWRVR